MNKLIVVTGGTKGIGKAIIEKFCAQGFDAVTCSRNEDDLQEFRRAIEERYSPVKLYTYKADLSKKKEVSAFAEYVKSIGVVPEVLVNNTGVFIPGQLLEEEEGALEKMIETNLYSAYHLSRHLLPAMVDRRQGHVFNMCSVASIMAYRNGGSYSISKFALLGMSKVLREELKDKGIRVTAVMPGATLTASWEGVELPPERFMKPEDVAEACWSAYLMNPQSVVEEIVIRPQLGDL
jgi:short-subunit dehydrogenase